MRWHRLMHWIEMKNMIGIKIDEEGPNTMKTLGQNMTYLLKAIRNQVK